jgi:ABC-type transport system involved in multi-copper enzyme maturation permease subunit
MSHRTLVLVGHSLTRIRGALIGLGLLLAGFQFLLTQVATYLMRQGAFTQLSALIPDFVRTAAGPEALAFMSFGGIVALGYFHPIVIAALVGLMITIATEPTGEIETRFVDLTLARPLRREEMITRTVLVLAAAGSVMLTAMVVGTWTGLTCCAPADADQPSFGLIASLAISLATIMACWAGVALAIGTMARRRSVGGAVAGVLALAAYLLDYLGRAWQPAAAASRLSPFHYFEPMTVIMGQSLNGWNAATLVAIGLAGTLASYVVIARRDI